MAKSCNLIGYAGIPATENKWLVGNAPRPSPARVAISRIEKAWLREATQDAVFAPRFAPSTLVLFISTESVVSLTGVFPPQTISLLLGRAAARE